MATRQLHDPIRVGLIGCGGIALAHLNGYRQCQHQGTVVALADVDLGAAEDRRKEFGLDAQCYADYRAMLDEADLAQVRQFES